MSMEIALNELDAALASWQEALEAVRMTVEKQGLGITDVLEVSALESLGLLEEARGRLRQTRVDSQSSEQLIDGLSETQREVIRIAHEEATCLRGFEQITALAELGRERGSQRGMWVDAVRRRLDRLPSAARAAQEAVAACWRELTRSASSAPTAPLTSRRGSALRPS